MPCRYISGSTSATFGLLRDHGGRIELRNRHRSPVVVDPLVVDPRRGHLDPARRRGDRARLGVAVAHHQPPAPLVELAGQRRRCRRRLRPRARRPASAGHPPGRSHRAPRASPRRPSSSVTTLNIGVPSSPAFQRRQSSFRFNEEGTSRPRTDGRSTGSGHTSHRVQQATSDADANEMLELHSGQMRSSFIRVMYPYSTTAETTAQTATAPGLGRGTGGRPRGSRLLLQDQESRSMTPSASMRRWNSLGGLLGSQPLITTLTS